MRNKFSACPNFSGPAALGYLPSAGWALKPKKSPKTVPYLIHKVSSKLLGAFHTFMQGSQQGCHPYLTSFEEGGGGEEGANLLNLPRFSITFLLILPAMWWQVPQNPKRFSKIVGSSSLTLSAHLGFTPSLLSPKKKIKKIKKFKSFLPQINPKKNLLLLAQFLRALEHDWQTLMPQLSLSLSLSLSSPVFHHPKLTRVLVNLDAPQNPRHAQKILTDMKAD